MSKASQVCYRMTRVLVTGTWTIQTGLYVRLVFGVFLAVGLATYKNLKLPRRLRFMERMKITLHTTYGGIPVILSKAVNPLGKKVPFDLNWQIAGYKCNGCKSSY